MRQMLVLASTSRYRRGLLERAGFAFTAVAPEVDEEALKDGRPPAELARFLARAKGESIARHRPHDIVIGSDQVAVHRGELLNKPGDRTNAIAQLARLAGDTHELLTAMAVFHEGHVYEHLEGATLTMRTLSTPQLERYIDADEPFACVGSYRLEARGITLFERIETGDHSAIVGLPLLALVRILATLGVEVP